MLDKPIGQRLNLAFPIDASQGRRPPPIGLCGGGWKTPQRQSAIRLLPGRALVGSASLHPPYGTSQVGESVAPSDSACFFSCSALADSKSSLARANRSSFVSLIAAQSPYQFKNHIFVQSTHAKTPMSAKRTRTRRCAGFRSRDGAYRQSAAHAPTGLSFSVRGHVARTKGRKQSFYFGACLL